MSENEFHVHPHHEHMIEHEAQHGPGLTQYVAIFTAILSTVGAIVSYQGSSAQNEAMLFKNDAVLKKAQASDQWNYYQAKAQKGHLMELGEELAPKEKKAYFHDQADKYNVDKKKIQADAETLELATKQANDKSEQLMRPHHFLALAMTLTQIAISLASITALTRKRWLFVVAGISASGGIALWVLAFL